MLTRLETMVMMGSDIPLTAVRQQIASGVDLLVHLGRLRDKSRKLLEITEVLGVENGEICLGKLFEFQETGEEEGRITGQWIKTGSLKKREKLVRSGIFLPEEGADG